MVSDAFDTVPAPPIALDASRRLWLAYMTCWLVSTTSRVRFNDALVPVVAGTFPIVFGALDNTCAVRIALDALQRLLVVCVPTRRSTWTWSVCSVDALDPNAPRAFLDAVDTAWRDRFTARVLWLAGRLVTRGSCVQPFCAIMRFRFATQSLWSDGGVWGMVVE